MSSFRDDPIKDLGFVVFPASAGLGQRDCRFHAFPLHLWKFTKTNSFMLTGSSAFEKTGSRTKVPEQSGSTYDLWTRMQKD